MRARLLSILAVAALAQWASAEVIVFEFTGNVSSINGTLPTAFADTQVGDPFTLTYTFESTAPDQDPDPDNGAYSAVATYDLKVGDHEQTGAPVPLNFLSVSVPSQRYGAFMSDLATDLTMVAIVDFAEGTLADDSLPTALPFAQRISTDFQFGGSNGFADCTLTGYRRVGAVDCSAIKKLKARCNNGTVKATVVSTLPEGTQLTLDNNGQQQAVTINDRGKAKAKWKNQTSGEHVVSILECLELTQTVTCD